MENLFNNNIIIRKDNLEIKNKILVKDHSNRETDIKDLKEELPKIELKESLKNIDNLRNYFNENKVHSENFELLNYVESGGESNVYSMNILLKNTSRETRKKRVIMKIIFSDKREKEIKREAIINAKLRNKNIIGFHGYSLIKEKESSYMILEEAKFSNIRNFQRKILKKPVFSESMICYIAYQVLSGLLFCHQRKIAHLDVKLQNIVVDEYLNFKLIDFSISLNYQNKGPNDKIRLPFKGTNFYIPLEILKSDSIAYKDLNKVDLYSLGVVLYNLCFGCYPYGLSHGDEKNYDVIQKKVEEGKLIFDDKARLSSYFLDFLSKLLEKDINKRINIYEAMNHYWVKAAELLMEEKEKCCNISIFTSYLLTDHINSFNQYMNK